MKVVRFTNVTNDCPRDLIPLKEVAKLTGYKYTSLWPSRIDRARIKQYCTIYKKGYAKRARVYYSRSQVDEYLHKYHLSPDLYFKRENFYTYKDISRLYNVHEYIVSRVYWILKKLNEHCPLEKYNIFKCFTIKRTNYIEKNTADKLFKILGYRKITDKD